MKAPRFFIMFVAAAAMMFASCGKDEENNGGGNTPELGVNEIIIDGVKYPVNVQLMGGMNFQATDANGQRFVINGGIMHSELGDNFDITYDLTGFCEGIHFGFSFESEQFFNLVYDNTGWKVMGMLDGTEYDGESMFSSGTATVRYDGHGLYINIDGTLKNGHTIAFILSTNPSNPSDPNPEPTQNELIIGTQHYMMESVLSITNEGVYLFGGNDPNSLFNVIVDIPSSMLGRTINLAQPSATDHFYINLQTTSLSFALQRGDEPINEINADEVDAVFSQGTMQVTRENGVVVCRVIGTLSNGTYVAFMMNIDEADIAAMDNQVIFDGQPSEASQVTVWRHGMANMPYELFIAGSVSVRVEVEQSAMENEINLAASNYPHRYRVTVNMWDQDTTAMQTNFYSGTFTGDIQASYWDIAAQAETELDDPLFTSGTLYVSEDEYAIGFSLTGTMRCGHSVSAQVRVSKSEIIED